MKRRDALAAMADLIAEALPQVVRRTDSSWSVTVGVAIDDVPCMHIEVIACGERRDSEELAVMPRIVGVANEEVPLFHDPFGQPDPLLREPPLVRAGTSDYRWTAERDVLREQIRNAARSVWSAWRAEAAEVFGRAPARWTEACVRIAGLENPLRWMAIDAEQQANALAGLRLPVEYAWDGSVWTAAWLGLGPVLDRVLPIEPALFERISAAAAIVRQGRRAGSA